MREWLRRLSTFADHYAVPVAAAVVAWIVAMQYVVPYAPAVISDSAALSGVLQGLIALAAFGLARRYL